MFGIRRIQELEYKLGEANDALEKETQEKKSFEEQLSTVTSHVTELEDKIWRLQDHQRHLFSLQAHPLPHAILPLYH